jgi:hypothetical protein
MGVPPGRQSAQGMAANLRKDGCPMHELRINLRCMLHCKPSARE